MNVVVSVFMLNVVLSVFKLNGVLSVFILNVLVLSVFMLNVIILSVIMVIVVAPAAVGQPAEHSTINPKIVGSNSASTQHHGNTRGTPGVCVIKLITGVIYGFRNNLECLSLNT